MGARKIVHASRAKAAHIIMAGAQYYVGVDTFISHPDPSPQPPVCRFLEDVCTPLMYEDSIILMSETSSSLTELQFYHFGRHDSSRLLQEPSAAAWYNTIHTCERQGGTVEHHAFR